MLTPCGPKQGFGMFTDYTVKRVRVSSSQASCQLLAFNTQTG